MSTSEMSIYLQVSAYLQEKATQHLGQLAISCFQMLEFVLKFLIQEK